MAMTQLDYLRWLLYKIEHVSGPDGGEHPAAAELKAWFQGLPQANKDGLTAIARKYWNAEQDARIAAANADKI